MRNAFLLSILCVPLVGAATRPASPVTVRHLTRADPAESIFIATVDLTDPRVSVHVSLAGADPDGPGVWQTTLLPTSEIAAREKWALAVNGDFFAAERTKDVEGRNTGYVRGKRATVTGPAVCDGRVVCTNDAESRPSLLIARDGTATIAQRQQKQPIDADVAQAIGGSGLLVQDGRVVHRKPKLYELRHPRTAVGLTRDHAHLILAVVDGRQPGQSLGMTGDELAHLMLDAGADVAMNLDGGGSTTLVARDGNQPRVLNAPSDGKERSVADALGITFDGPLSLE